MLTRDIALARLRATGSLSPDATPTKVVDCKNVNTACTRALQVIIKGAGHHGGRAWLAPAAAHTVLP